MERKPLFAPRPELAGLIALHAIAGAVYLGVAAAVRQTGNERDPSLTGPAAILGARHLAEAAVLSRRRSRRWVLGCASLDGAHAASMLLAAAVYQPRRAVLLASAAEATCCAGFAGAIAVGASAYPGSSSARSTAGFRSTT